MRPPEVINHPISRSNFDVGGVVVEHYKVIRDHGERKRARLRIVKRRPVYVNLGLIQKIWFEAFEPGGFASTYLLPDGNDQTNQRRDIIPGVPLTVSNPRPALQTLPVCP